MIVYGTGKGLSFDERIADVLEYLESSELTFFLGGSRYCGDALKLSDWDFYVQGNPDWPTTTGKDLHEKHFNLILREGGKQHKDDDYSTDDGTYAVYSLNCKDGAVHISIVKDITTRHRMYKMVVLDKWPKQHRKNKRMWNELYQRIKNNR